MESSRPAQPADLDRLIELADVARREIGAERGGELWAVRESSPPPRRVELLHAMADPDTVLEVGCFGDYPVGFGLMRLEELRNGDRLGVLSDIFVEAPFRGVSVGDAMMIRLLAWAREHGCRGVDSLVLPGMRESKNFFERFGLKARALIVHQSFLEPSEANER